MIFATILAIAAADLRVLDLQIEKEQGSGKATTDLGTYGETFPIQEKSLLEIIQEKLQRLGESCASGKSVNSRVVNVIC